MSAVGPDPADGGARPVIDGRRRGASRPLAAAAQIDRWENEGGKQLTNAGGIGDGPIVRYLRRRQSTPKIPGRI
jgi:hypothetical protein